MTFPRIPGYIPEAVIGKGGMATVYLAERDPALTHTPGRKYAVKVFETDQMDPRIENSFLQESALLSELHHINIVSIYEWGELDGGGYYLVEEYLEGGNLRERMKSITLESFGEIQAMGMLIELCHILQFIHNHGVIHCDIKPANIMFRRDGSLVLTDFGIAKRITDPATLIPSKTIVASPDYCSPEQARGMPFDHRTDIYSAGVLFLKMLTGVNPYHANDLQQSLLNHLQLDTPVLNDHLSRFQPIIDRMLARDPDERYQSMQECMDSINLHLRVTPIPPKPLPEEIPVLRESVAEQRAALNTQPTQSITCNIGSYNLSIDDFLKPAG